MHYYVQRASARRDNLAKCPGAGIENFAKYTGARLENSAMRAGCCGWLGDGRLGGHMAYYLLYYVQRARARRDNLAKYTGAGINVF